MGVSGIVEIETECNSLALSVDGVSETGDRDRL